MATNTELLKASTQDYYLRLVLLSPREYRTSDVNTDGADAGVDPYPPAGDPESSFSGALDITHYELVDGIQGSVTAGGYSAKLRVQDSVATLPEFVGVEVWAIPYHGNVRGTPGPTGWMDEVRVFKGYVQKVDSENTYPSTIISLQLMSSNQFTQGSSLSRGIEWGPDTPHGGPVTVKGAMAHLIETHTNLTSRSAYSLRFEDYPLNRLTVNQGSLHDMLRGCLINALEAWVYFDRDDNLHARVHPNLAPNDWAYELSDPIIEYDDDMVLSWKIPEASGRTVASVNLTATTSDFSSINVLRNLPSGIGGRESRTDLRYDDQGLLGAAADLWLPHLNRRYQNITIEVPLNLVADIGNIVCLTHSDYWRGINWTQKKFVVTGVDYQVDLNQRQWGGTITLDEVIVG